jgi:hypothetical protein
LFLDDASSHMHEEQTELVGEGQPAYRPGARVQHRLWGISPGARGDFDLPAAERSTVASKAGALRHRPTSSCSATMIIHLIPSAIVSMHLVTALWRGVALINKAGRESSGKTALNPSANRAGWSAATPGIRVGKNPIKSSSLRALAECRTHPSISG